MDNPVEKGVDNKKRIHMSKIVKMTVHKVFTPFPHIIHGIIHKYLII